VRTYVTDPLTEPVVVSGRIAAHLFAATSGTDSVWIVKLIDVYPETYSDETMRGFQLMIAGDVIRGRYHKSIEKPAPLVPNVPVEYVIPSRPTIMHFSRGTASWCRCKVRGSR
jgi:predicted acyl esterase